MSTRTIAGQALLPEVESFLSKEIHGAVIGGREVFASNGDTFDTHDPGSGEKLATVANICLLYTSPSPRDRQKSRMPSSA